MKFSWTREKRGLNLRKHGFDFVDAEEVFSGVTITLEDPRDYVVNSATTPPVFWA